MTVPEAPNLVIARLLDYFGLRTDWQRRLWNPGTVTVLEEVHEALKFLENGHLREKTVVDLALTAVHRAGPDIGIGPPAIRSAVTATLSASPTDVLTRFRLEHLLQSVKSNYLGRWAEAFDGEPGILDREPDIIDTEQASRLLAGHLPLQPRQPRPNPAR